MRSDTIKVGFERAPHRTLLKATGAMHSPEDFQKPFIGIANSYSDLIPGHVHLQDYGRVLKKSVRAAGGVPFEFNTIGVDDGIAMGHLGMRWITPCAKPCPASTPTSRTSSCLIIKSGSWIRNGAPTPRSGFWLIPAMARKPGLRSGFPGTLSKPAGRPSGIA